MFEALSVCPARNSLHELAVRIDVVLRIIEVGPRDGLQNEPVPISTETKRDFIAALMSSGLKEIEATSFVSPKWVPQLGDAKDLWPQLPPGGLYSALVPNGRGLEGALEVGVERIAVFTAASPAFVQKNINMSIEESIAGFADVIKTFRNKVPGGFVRGYVSTIFACPYAGEIEPTQVVRVAESLFEIGVDEVSLGDTIGVGAAVDVRRLNEHLQSIEKSKIAWHFHDTRGTAIACVSAALDLGYESFDASAGGLGGCPYAPGAGGNLATDDLVYFLERSGITTGIDRVALAQASLPILEAAGRLPIAKAQVAQLAVCK